MLVCHDDPDAYLDPRKDNDNLDIMACWHSRYDLGDMVEDKGPEEFWARLVREHVPESKVLAAAEAGKLPGIKIKRRSKDLVDIYETCRWETPLGNSNPKWEVAYEGVNNGHAAACLLEDLTVAHCMVLLKPYIECMPVWLYEHSGITISCGERKGVYSDRWDSMRAGWILMFKEDAEKLDGSKDWREKAIEYMTASVSEYDKYISGEVYWYELYSRVEGDNQWANEEESCGGFLGSDICENGVVDNFNFGLSEAIDSDNYEVKLVKYQQILCVD